MDLFLVHWPVAMNPKGNDDRFPKHADGSRDLVLDWSHVETWRGMQKLLKGGKVKAIGVANYSVQFLEELLKGEGVDVVPAVNQIENHPSLPQQEVVDFCKSKGIHVTAYSPLGSAGSPLISAAPVVEVAKSRGVAPATVLLSWHRKSLLSPLFHFPLDILLFPLNTWLINTTVARGSSVLAKSVTNERIKANKELITLEAGDLKILDDYAADLEKSGKVVRYVYPAFGVQFGFKDQPGGIVLGKK